MAYFRNSKKDILRFVVSVIVFVAVSFIIRFFANSSKFLFSHYGDVLKSAVCISFILYIWNYSKKIIKTFLLVSLLYVLPALLKLLKNMPLTGKEIVDSFCFANLICSAILLLLLLIHLIKNKFIKKSLLFLTDVIVFIAILLPFLHIGYFLLSGQILSAAIVLTLFQTNFSEAISYLKDQNFIAWSFGIFISLMFCVSGILLFNSIEKQTDLKITQKKKTVFIFSIMLTIALAILGYKVCTSTANNVQTLQVFTQTRNELKQYSEYRKAKVSRMKKLEKLQGLGINAAKGGVYVLVIGESETRDHMNAYGYKNENTPWLSEMAKSKETILFTNAYSNHTHTVPVLTYALSGKNQYNNIPLKQAYSIMEVAKAAGYKTFWISNQIKYGAWDTPTAEMASTADQEIWINGNVGKTNNSQFYDEEIATQVSLINFEKEKNVFIVCHLMGCHGSYQDRYPERFEKYKVTITNKEPYKTIHSYDNSVYYNDFVLEKIYKAVSNNTNFKAMIYLSDHGEEPDERKSHEATKFTWQMARIPFIIFLSKTFLRDSSDVFKSLSANKNKYWTNDLLYDALLEIMGIKNAPDRNEDFNIASDKYNLKKNNLKTLHGKKALEEEIVAR